MGAHGRYSAAAILPYAVWMALLFALPATAEAYAWRTAATALALAATLPSAAPAFRPWAFTGTARAWAWGLAAGLLVYLLWVFPERFAGYRETSLLAFAGLAGPPADPAAASPYDPAVCGRLLTAVKLIGSAFVIAPVEELFFRSFLYRWLCRGDWLRADPRTFDRSAFLWMVALFALEHHTRLAAGAMAGACYGWLAIRKGLGPAILAHVMTNLALAVHVITAGAWGLW